MLHCWIKLERLAKLLAVRLRQKPLFPQLVAKFSSLGARLMGRDINLEEDETSTEKIIQLGLAW